MISEDAGTKFGEGKKQRIITIALLVVALIVLIVGIVLIVVAATKKEDKSASTSTTMEPQKNSVPSTKEPQKNSVPSEPGSTPTVPVTKAPSSGCDFSEEAQNAGLPEFLSHVKSTYFKLHPYDVVSDPDVTPVE